MDKKIVIAIVLIMVVLGASIIYFKFNNNKIIDNSQSKHCYPLWKIESGLELTASQDYASECTSKKNKEDCELVDVYRASTDNFGNLDGIIDCEWK